MNFPTDGATVLARWQHEGMIMSPRTVSKNHANITNLQTDANTKISHEAERNRREKALDESI
jgi:hypothetical protein